MLGAFAFQAVGATCVHSTTPVGDGSAEATDRSNTRAASRELSTLGSMGSVVAVPELLFQARQAQSVTYSPTPIVLAVRAGDEGRLFGSVTVTDIADAIHVPGVDKRKIILSSPIKLTGRHSAAIRLHADVTADVTIDVRAAKK